MLSIVRRLLGISDVYKRELKLAIVVAFFEGIFTIGPQMLVMWTIYNAITTGIDKEFVLRTTLLLIGTIVMRVIFHRLVDGLQSGTGYKIFAQERMRIGEHLKRLPMGYFSEGMVGEVSSIVTTDILFVEMFGMSTLSKIVNAYINMFLGSLMMFIFDWRIGLISVLIFAIGYKLLKGMDDYSKKHADKRQAQMGVLVGSVIEFVKGIGVIKVFNLQGEQMKKLHNTFRVTRDYAIDFEQGFAKKFIGFDGWFGIGVGLVVLMSSRLMLGGQIDVEFGLMILIYVFQFFVPFQMLGSVVALARIMETALDRYDEVMGYEVIDKNGKNIELDNFDIEFKDVSFAYEDKKVLSDISFAIKEKTMTALVGKSGCGKTTITNLIARFWDVNEGEIRIGGQNIKDMTCDSLLKNISMVFQNVYLFNDTILANIKIARPEASMKEVIEACKKARCYEFIEKLEHGFETMVGEGGASLSGGESQRISIARAILKDAPIVLLDEATASVDPDNEKYIQEAISELVKNKTLIVIAHKLKTIKNADQIVVLDDGKLVDRGSHQDILKRGGLYKELWDRRTKARNWEVSKKSKQRDLELKTS
ncbi:MAG: ABC transporter ATP-binding protein/permease [Tissierellales bacterium]|jgi:ATP-binding cassette subfamily B protein|nr:ABC transporter ATP-binding protein/permease [Tissierellales bacterium]